MTDTNASLAPAVAKVLAALAALGEAPAASVAEHAGIGYSTTTPKLRSLEEAGVAERFRVESRTMWRLTGAGRAAVPANDERLEPAADLRPASIEPVTTKADPGDATDDLQPSVEAAGTANAPCGAGDGNDTATTVDNSSDGQTIDTTKPDVTDPSRDHEPGSVEGPAESAAQAHADTGRRAGGSLRGAVLHVLEAHPDRQYKTGELCRLIDTANAGNGAAKASAGAVANAVIKLVAAGVVIQTVERPATFQLAPTSSGR